MARGALTTPAAAGLAFAGGAIGGGVRILITEITPPEPGFPWIILAINIVGSAILGAVVGRGQERGSWRYFPLIGPGMLGGFTTFSTMAALTWTTSLDPLGAVLGLAGTMVVCVLAAAGGYAIGTMEAERELSEELP